MIHIRLLLIYTALILGTHLSSQNIDGGDITLPNGDTSAIVCLGSSDEKVFDVILKGNQGEISAWVITDTFGIVVAIPTSPPFDLDNYTINPLDIWHLSYNQISGLNIGSNKDSITGDFDYSNSIRLSQKRLFAAKLSLIEGDTVISCSGDGLGDSLVFSIIMNNGLENIFVITDIDDKILMLSTDSIVNADLLESGLCFVQHLTYEQGLLGLVKDSILSDLKGCFELSNKISISKTVVNGGDIYLEDGRTNITICVGDGIADAFTPTLINDQGTSKKWIITDSSGIILALVNNGTFNLEGVGPGIAIIYHVRYESIVNLERNKNIDSLMGCYDLSNPITVIRIEGDTKPGILSSPTMNSFCNGDKKADIVELSIVGNLGDNYTNLIVDQSGVILDTFNGNSYDFEGFAKVNSVFIFGLSYIEGIDRLAIGNNIEDLEGCYAFSNSIPVQIENASGGEIAFPDQDSIRIICSGDGFDDLIAISVKDTCGLIYNWAITDTEGEILNIQPSGAVNIDIGSQDTTLLQLVAYNVSIDGLSIGENIKDLVGCYGISNSLRILNSFGAANGGILVTTDDLIRCILPNQIDTMFFNTSDFAGDTSFYLVLNDKGEIINIFDTDYLITSNLENGTYDLYHVSSQEYSIGFTIGNTLTDIHGCYDLSNSLSINITSVNGGIISSNIDPKIPICFGNIQPDTITISKNGIIGQTSYIVVTDTMGIIIDVYINKNIVVKSTFPNNFYIWNIAFNDNVAGLVIGLSIHSVAGCFHLSNNISFELNRISPLNISFSNSENTLIYCSNFGNSIINITTIGGVGKDTLYVITDGDNNILATQDSSNIDISQFDGEVLKITAYNGSDSLYNEGNQISNSTNCIIQSNVLTIINQKPIGGELALPGGVDTLSYCLLPTSKDTISIEANNFSGNNQEVIFTDLNGKIITHYTDLRIIPSNINVDSVLIYHISYFDSISIVNDSLVTNIEGCYDLSDPKLFVINRLDGGLLYFGSIDTMTISCFGDSIGYTFFESNTSIVSSYIISESDSTLIKVVNAIDDLNLNTLSPGSYFIWHVSSLDTISFNEDLDSLGSCAHLSNRLSLEIQENIIGVSNISLNSITTICDGDEVSIIDLSTIDSTGLITYFIVVDSLGKILAIEDTTSFVLPAEGVDFVYQIGYNIRPANFAIGTSVNDLIGCYGFSNGVKIAPIIFDGGEISIQGSKDIKFCGVGIKVDSLYPQLSTKGSVNGIWIVTDINDIVIDTFNHLPVLIDNNGPTICFVRYVSYLDGLIIPEIDSTYARINGCYDESNKIMVTKSLIRGGNIKVNGGQELNICSGDQVIDQVDINISGATGPNNAWILSDTMSNIISILATPPNNFNGLPTGSCFLWHIRYNSNDIAGLNVGSSIGNLKGCFETSNPIRINKLSVNGGTLSVQDSLRELTICVDDGFDETITPKLVNEVGLQKLWMLTSAIGEIIALDVQPPFSFEGEEEGQTFIWNVSYIDLVQGLELGQFLADIEGCVAISNPIRIRKKVGTDCVVATNDIINLDDFKITPNPTSGYVFINNSLHQKGQLGLINSMGQTVMTIDILSQEEIKLDLSNYSDGLYHVLIKTSVGSYDYSIIKI